MFRLTLPWLARSSFVLQSHLPTPSPDRPSAGPSCSQLLFFFFFFSQGCVFSVESRTRLIDPHLPSQSRTLRSVPVSLMLSSFLHLDYRHILLHIPMGHTSPHVLCDRRLSESIPSLVFPVMGCMDVVLKRLQVLPLNPSCTLLLSQSTSLATTSTSPELCIHFDPCAL